MIKANSLHMPLKDHSVQAIITSPPYWFLRKYDIPCSVYGGQAQCKHEWGEEAIRKTGRGKTKNVGFNERCGNSPGARKQEKAQIYEHIIGPTCNKCGAWRGQLGLEPTPELYTEHLMQVMAECWRVLKDNGVCFINLGQTYANQDVVIGYELRYDLSEKERLYVLAELAKCKVL